MSTASMVKLTASPRAGLGKSEARRLRAQAQIPAVAYGKAFPSTTLAVAPKDVLGVLKSDHGQNSVIELEYGAGKKMLAMIRDFSVHPVKRSLEHVDFVEVKLDQPVDVQIPLVPLGKPVGVTQGGIIRQVYRTLPVRCLPDRIPLKIEIDIAHLKLNEAVATQDLKLAEGVTVRLAPEQTIVSIVAPEKERAEDTAAAAPGAAAAGAAPAAAAGAKDAKAAPAAGAKDAKAAPAADAKKK
ncbi:MAG: 50S ribosomal protein L25 [Polyangiaceae bacterium]